MKKSYFHVRTVNRKFRPAIRWRVPRTLFLICLPLVCVIGLVQLLSVQLHPSLERAARSTATRVAVKALNEAVSQELAEVGDSSNLVSVHRESGADALTIARFNLQAITHIQELSTSRAESAIEQLHDARIQLPIAHVFAGVFGSTSNISLPLRLSLLGSAHSAVTAEVQSEGVNQVVHVLYLTITAQVQVVAPFVAEPVTVQTKAPIAYVVLSGPVPRAYFPATGYSGSVLSEKSLEKN